jgi:hypothetical protein
VRNNTSSSKTPPLPKSTFFFAVDNTGEIIWRNFLPEPSFSGIKLVNNSRQHVQDEYFVLESKQLNWFEYLPQSRFTNGDYQLPITSQEQKNDKNIPVIVVFDCVNGSIEYTPLLPQIEEDMVFDAFFGSQKSGISDGQTLFLRYVDEKEDSAQFVKINLD